MLGPNSNRRHPQRRGHDHAIRVRRAGGLVNAGQFWLHTRVIGRLGLLEALLNTPSHHRVHHGRDPGYVDRNYGGVLIVWDRLFGTYAEERDEPDYGLSPSMSGSDPVWANLWGFIQIAREFRRGASVRGKLGAVFGPPRWSGGTGAALHSLGGTEPGSPLPLSYALIQFLLLLGATVVLLDDLGRAPLADVAGYGALAAFTLTGVSAVMDDRPWVRRFEVVRLGAVGLAALAPGLRETGLVPAKLQLGYAVVSLVMIALTLGDLGPLPGCRALENPGTPR